MAEWLTIEVFDGDLPATAWWRAYGEELIEAAVTNRAVDWVRHEHRWGVVLEVLFDDDEAAETFRCLPVVAAALDAVPDRTAGLLVYRGRGGGAGRLARRRPRPRLGSGAAALPVPTEPDILPPALREPTSPVHS